MRCAIYARYSSDMQKQTSIEDQVAQCKKAIEERNWRLLPDQIYADEAISGYDVNRKAYNALKESAQTRIIDYIIVDDLSRFGRNTAESIMAYQELTSLGINILSISDHLDTSNESAKMPYYFKSFMNELFLDDLKKRVRRGLIGRVRRNMSAGGRIFGYRNVPIFNSNGEKDRFGNTKKEGVKIEIDADQARTVKTIFKMSAKGHGYRAIAQYLNENRVASPRHNRNGNSWCTSAIRSILLNPKYKGDWTYNKTKYIKVRSKTGKTIRKQIQRPKSDWVNHQNEELRIISDDLWKASRKKDRTSSHSAGIPREGGKKYVLAGILKCGCCGGTMLTSTYNGYSRLVCSNHWNRGNAVCSNDLRIERIKVEEFILSNVQKKIMAENNLDKITKHALRLIGESKSKTRVNIHDIENKLAVLEKEISNLTEFILGGDISDRIRDLLREKETEHENLLRMKIKPRASDEIFDKKSLRAFIRERLSEFTDLMDSNLHKAYLIRKVLERLFPQQITLTPVKTTNSMAYKINGKGFPLNMLEIQPSPFMFYVPKGI